MFAFARINDTINLRHNEVNVRQNNVHRIRIRYMEKQCAYRTYSQWVSSSDVSVTKTKTNMILLTKISLIPDNRLKLQLLMIWIRLHAYCGDVIR